MHFILKLGSSSLPYKHLYMKLAVKVIERRLLDAPGVRSMASAVFKSASGAFLRQLGDFLLAVHFNPCDKGSCSRKNRKASTG
jgi:hypothetical protein